MSTPAVTTDPYAAYGGAVSGGGGSDPYASYGGKVIAPPPPASDTRSLLQKAKDNFNANTQGAQPGDGAIKGFIENIGQGGGEFVRAVAHPIDSISSTIHSLAHPLDAAHAEVDALYADPSRFIGNTIGQLGTGGIAGEVAAPVAEAAATFAPKIAGRAILLGKTPEAAYESALKPSVTLSPAERTSVVNTGLKNSIPISTSGVEKIGELIDNYNKDIQNTVNSAGPNRPIDPNQVATRADAAKAKFYNQVNAQGDVNAIDASKQQFLAEQGAKSGTPAKPPQPTGLLDAQGNPIMSTGTPAQPATPAPPMSASDAQAMKQGTYQVLRGKFGEQGSAAVEAQKNLARGLKEEIANQFPEIGNLNAQESKLLDLQPVLERAVARNSNHQLIGIGTPVAGAAVKAVTGSGGAAAAASVLKSVLDNPMVKSRLAIAVSKGARIPYADALGRVGAYSTALSAASPANPGDGQPLEMTQPVPEENLANQGYGAMAALPAPVARIARALNPTVTQGPARPDDAGGQGAVANVIQGAGNNNIEINDSASFKRYANQTMGHEITHLWQNSLPPSIQANIPADDPDPKKRYDISDVEALRNKGNTLATIPREKAATIVQTYIAQPSQRKKLQPWIDDMNTIPLSSTLPTDPNAVVINMTPRAPLPPPNLYGPQ